MPSDRRVFLRQSLLVSCATILARPTRAAVSQAGLGGSGGLLARMKWLNEPASSNRTGDQLVIHSRAKTDFWRKIFYGYITDNGHFFSLPVTGDFAF